VGSCPRTGERSERKPDRAQQSRKEDIEVLQQVSTEAKLNLQTDECEAGAIIKPPFRYSFRLARRWGFAGEY